MNKDDKPATGIMENMTDEANKEKQLDAELSSLFISGSPSLLLINYIFLIQFDTFNCWEYYIIYRMFHFK